MALADNKAKIQALLDGINALPEAGSGDPVLQEKTVTPATSAQSVTPDSGYDGLSKVTVNAMPSATQATPSIEVSSAGLITATVEQSAGYVAAGTKSATKQLTAQAAQTITPGTSDKTIAAGKYLTGVQTIKGDANLKADNITEGISIFGVAGANPYEKTATTTEVNTQATKLAELKTILEGKAAGGGGSSSQLVSVENAGIVEGIYINLAEEPTGTSGYVGFVLRSGYSTMLPVGAYVAVADTASGFPTSYTPADSAEMVSSFDSGSTTYNVYKIKAACRFYMDD